MGNTSINFSPPIYRTCQTVPLRWKNWRDPFSFAWREGGAIKIGYSCLDFCAQKLNFILSLSETPMWNDSTVHVNLIWSSVVIAAWISVSGCKLHKFICDILLRLIIFLSSSRDFSYMLIFLLSCWCSNIEIQIAWSVDRTSFWSNQGSSY